jgi:hypothetical protein
MSFFRLVPLDFRDQSMSAEATPPPQYQSGPEHSRAQHCLRVAGDFSAGLTMGGLIGLILGMSVSPVAATVVGGLVALLASFFGLLPSPVKSEKLASLTRERLAAPRLIGFGIAATGALLCGLYLRTHGVLSPSPRVVAARWVDARFSPEQARLLTAYELVGTFPPEPPDTVAQKSSVPDKAEGAAGAGVEGESGRKKGDKESETPGLGPGFASSRLSVLFADEVSACNELGKRFKDGPAAVKAWKSFSGAWAVVAAQVEKTEIAADQMQALETIRRLLCPH